MFNHLAVHSPRRTACRAVSVLLLALVSASCSRQLATAPGATLSGPDHRSASTSTTLDNVGNQIVVVLAPGADASSLAAQYGAVLLDVQQGFALLEPQSGGLLDLPLMLDNDSRVLSSEGNQMAMVAEARQKSWAFDDGFGSGQACSKQAAVADLDLADAHLVGRGAGVLVAVLDTGIDPGHPLLAGRIAGGWDFVDNDPDPTDVANGVDEDRDGVVDGAYGHGTHVAGIVAITSPQASLLVVRVLDAEGRGDVKSVAAGIRWAVDHGARVINLSLGLLQPSPAIETALAEAQARRVVCVASAGNWGAEFPQEFPALSPRVISVAATDAADRPAAFTSYGRTVDVCAPGVAIRSAYPGGRYLLWSGTSMAAPFVSGTAALLIGLHPDWNLSLLMTRVQHYARPVAEPSLAPGPPQAPSRSRGSAAAGRGSD